MKGHPIFAALYDLIQRPAEKKFLGPHRAYLAGAVRGRVLAVHGPYPVRPFVRGVAARF